LQGFFHGRRVPAYLKVIFGINELTQPLLYDRMIIDD
jgi:hypothetical protein